VGNPEDAHRIYNIPSPIITTPGRGIPPHKTTKIMAQKVYNIYDISSGDGVFVQTVTKEITAKMICRQHNRNGERNYMYLQSYE
jgi:hypothetical protein